MEVLEENTRLKQKVFKLEKKNILVKSCYYELRWTKQSMGFCTDEVLVKNREINNLMDEIDFCNEQVIIQKNKNEK